VALAAVVGLSGWWAWQRYRPPVIPDIPIQKADPAVAAAIESARQKVQEQPRSGSAWGKLGMLLVANGFEAQAGPCFQYAEKFDRTNPRWPYYQALACLSREAEALACLRRAVALADQHEPENFTPRHQLVELLFQLGRIDEAEQLLSETSAKGPQPPRTVYLTALLAEHRNEPRTAIDLYLLLVDDPSSRQKACAHLAVLYRRLPDQAAAVKYDRLARESPPDAAWDEPYGKALHALAVSQQRRLEEAVGLLRANRSDEAMQILQELAESPGPPNHVTHTLIGAALAKRGQLEEAERALLKAIAIAPGPTACSHLGVVYLNMGEARAKQGDRSGAAARYRQGVARLRQGLKIKPDHSPSLCVLGKLLDNLGEHEEAIATLRLALRHQPAAPLAHLFLGQALARTGERQKALEHFQLAVRFAGKGDPVPANELKRFLEDDKKK
jgi:tetratricopeptide (TPR) repeat protein